MAYLKAQLTQAQTSPDKYNELKNLLSTIKDENNAYSIEPIWPFIETSVSQAITEEFKLLFQDDNSILPELLWSATDLTLEKEDIDKIEQQINETTATLQETTHLPATTPCRR